MKKTIKEKIKLVIIAVLIIWPVIHMVLSKKGIINPWKLSGWGMYTVNDPKYVRTKVILIEKNGQFP